MPSITESMSNSFQPNYTQTLLLPMHSFQPTYAQFSAYLCIDIAEGGLDCAKRVCVMVSRLPMPSINVSNSFQPTYAQTLLRGD